MSQRDMFFPPLGGDAITAEEYAMYGHQLGVEKLDNFGNRYRFVKCDNVNAYNATGRPMGVRAAGGSENDMSDDLAASNARLFRGLSASKFTGTKVFGWMMVEGSLETALEGAGMTVTTDGNVVQGGNLIWGADGVIHGATTEASAPADQTIIGQAAADDSSTSLTKGFISGKSLNSHAAA